MKRIKVIALSLFCVAVAVLSIKVISSASYTENVEDTTVKCEKADIEKPNGRKPNFGKPKINIRHTREEKEETTSENSVVSSNEIEYVTGNIFIGDSRFVGMNNICNMDSIENTYVVAKVGEGYNYLVTTVIPKVESIMASNEDVEHWNIISGFGINDLGNLNNYVTAYESMDYDNAELILVSVNPVEYHGSITNDKVEQFNNIIKEIDGTQYIDTYSIVINETGYSTDGVHYKNDVYKKIYECIMTSI